MIPGLSAVCAAWTGNTCLLRVPGGNPLRHSLCLSQIVRFRVSGTYADRAPESSEHRRFRVQDVDESGREKGQMLYAVLIGTDVPVLEHYPAFDRETVRDLPE